VGRCRVGGCVPFLFLISFLSLMTTTTNQIKQPSSSFFHLRGIRTSSIGTTPKQMMMRMTRGGFTLLRHYRLPRGRTLTLDNGAGRIRAAHRLSQTLQRALILHLQIVRLSLGKRNGRVGVFGGHAKGRCRAALGVLRRMRVRREGEDVDFVGNGGDGMVLLLVGSVVGLGIERRSGLGDPLGDAFGVMTRDPSLRSRHSRGEVTRDSAVLFVLFGVVARESALWLFLRLMLQFGFG
jgi:hypothetical protein